LNAQLFAERHLNSKFLFVKYMCRTIIATVIDLKKLGSGNDGLLLEGVLFEAV